MKDQSTLLHRIYKAKYFPKVNFFELGLGNNPSYAWRGVWEAKKWLIQGCRWRIRDGKIVFIWKDHWIPSHRSLQLEASGISEENKETQ